MSSISPYIPTGSYQDSARDIEVTIKALCKKLDGTEEISTVTIHQSKLQGVQDIKNDNGKLIEVVG